MRMDERLMQVVRLSDSLMRSDAAAAAASLHTRPFGMTPLGPRLGLVQWVDHTVPIFQVRPEPCRNLRVFRAPLMLSSDADVNRC